VYNGGGGYDNTTGVFTVPATGVYCFMALGSPGSTDEKESIWVNIKLDDQGIANLGAYFRERSSSQAVVCAKAGQKVCLKSCKDDNKFWGGWNTSFSGFLISPDV
jgi:hypothetical protein